ncbi:MAG: carboxyl transferase [Lachnospiraceae bacterium]|nr:carboxyl transferase [Lachnospiraceae bacterium]
MEENMAQESAKARISALLDENSFVEIGSMITARNTDFNMADAETPGDGVVTGYGVVDGHLVYVYSQDKTVLGGSIGEMHAKKIVKIYEMAMKVGAPVIGLIDCAGMRLQETTDALNAFGEIYAAQAKASGVIPQLTGIFGTCGGGLAVVNGLTDFTFMANDAKLFVNSPNAVDGNIESKLDTSSAEYQAEETGMVDYVGTEAEVLAAMRQLVTMIPANNEEDLSEGDVTDDLNRASASVETLENNAAYVLSQLSDNGVFVEMKKAFAKDMVVGFVRLAGRTVGAVANNHSKLSAMGCIKAADFVKFCDAFNIPVLSLTDVEGFATTLDDEKRMAKTVSKLTYAFASATVPKVNVVVGNALSSAYVAMNSKAIGADMVFAWPTAKIGIMEGKEAVRIMYATEIAAADDKIAEIDKLAAEYDAMKLSASSAAKRGYVDTIIEAVDTRKYVIGAFEMLYTKSVELPVKKHGTI